MLEPILILLTKDPKPGFVKTRFFPNVSPDIAAAIALDMIEETVATAVTAWPGPVKLLVSPQADHPELTKMANRFGIDVAAQSPGDLGEKMESALCDAMKEASSAAVMGCDIPTVSEALLKFAFGRLTDGATVIGPSADGGFYMAGLQHCIPGMFSGIEWSVDTVLLSILSRMHECGIQFDVILPCLQDIDTWSDFQILAEKFPKFAKYLYKPVP